MPTLLRRCFVIGPMGNMSRLRRLANDVVRPLLEPFGYVVSTPDHADIGLVMHQVMLSLEQADLLIADLTGSNPNVFYELGIYHAFGKPYITVKEEEAGQSENEKTPFDVAAYRYVAIDLRDVTSTQAILRDFLTRTQLIEQIDRLDFFSNPVTDFYLSPIAEIPTAIGLAKNYVKNFMVPMLPAIFNLVRGTSFYPVNVMIEAQPDPDANQLIGELRPLTMDERKKLRIEIWIPNNLAWAEKAYLSELQQQPDRPFLNAQVTVDRSYNCFARIEPDGTVVIIDVPTILSSLNQSIEQRRRSIHDVHIKAAGWEVLEQQEIERFDAKCQLFVNIQLTDISRRRVNIVRWDGR